MELCSLLENKRKTLYLYIIIAPQSIDPETKIHLVFGI